METWLTTLLSFIAAIIGAVVVLIIHHSDTKDKYRKITFEQRLKVHQEAISHCYQVYHSLFRSKMNQEEKKDTINKMEKWWENNCLSLDEKSRRKTLDVIGDAREYIDGLTESQVTFLRTFRETLNVISKGIGKKHLIEDHNLAIEEKTLQG